MKGSSVGVLAVLIINAVCAGGSAPYPQDREGISNLVSAIVAANEQAISRLEQGMGTATCSNRRKGTDYNGREITESEEYLAKFRFKGEKSRYDGYKWDASTKTQGQHFVSSIDAVTDTMEYAVGKQQVFTYDGGLNWRDRWVSGKDFRPEVFLQPAHQPLLLSINNSVKSAKELRTVSLENGLMRIEFEWGTAGDWPLYLKATFDPQKDYALVEYEQSSVLGTAGSELQQIVRYQVEWQAEAGGLYPSHIKYECRERVSSWEKQPIPDMTLTSEVSIREFDASAEVRDEDFTLDALRLPAGVEVIDTVKDVSYRIGGVDTKEKNMRVLLDDMTVDSSATESPSASTAGDRAGDIAAAPVRDTADKGEASLPGRAHVWVGVILIVAAAGTLAALVLTRRKRG